MAWVIAKGDEVEPRYWIGGNTVANVLPDEAIWFCRESDAIKASVHLPFETVLIEIDDSILGARPSPTGIIRRWLSLFRA